MPNLLRLLRCARLMAFALFVMMTAGKAPPDVPAPRSVPLSAFALRVQPAGGAVFITVAWVPAPCDTVPGRGGADAVYSLYPAREGDGPLSACALLGGAQGRLHV